MCQGLWWLYKDKPGTASSLKELIAWVEGETVAFTVTLEVPRLSIMTQEPSEGPSNSDGGIKEAFLEEIIHGLSLEEQGRLSLGSRCC